VLKNGEHQQAFSFPTSYQFHETYVFNVFKPCQKLHEQGREKLSSSRYWAYQASEFRIYLKIKTKLIK